MYVEHREEEVERDVDLVVEIEVSYEPMDPESFKIVSTSLTEPSDGFGIETQNNYDWPKSWPLPNALLWCHHDQCKSNDKNNLPD